METSHPTKGRRTKNRTRDTRLEEDWNEKGITSKAFGKSGKFSKKRRFPNGR